MPPENRERTPAVLVRVPYPIPAVPVSSVDDCDIGVAAHDDDSGWGAAQDGTRVSLHCKRAEMKFIKKFIFPFIILMGKLFIKVPTFTSTDAVKTHWSRYVRFKIT